MIFPIRTDRPLRSTPYVNYGLILLNVTIFALQKLADGGALRFDFMAWSLDPGEPTLATFFSYAALHGGWMHLIGNMVFLYIFGNNVSDKLGQVGYLAFYLAGGVFAGIGYVLLATPNAAGMYPPVVGASGAVAAVTGAYLVLFPRSRITVLLFFILIGTFEVPGLWFVLIFFLKDLFSALGPASGVAHTAHIAGTVFGVTVSLGLLATRLLERDQWDLLALISRWNRRRQFKSAVAKGWDPYGTVPMPESREGNAGPRRRPVRGSGAGGPPPLPDAAEQAVLEVRAQVSEAMAHRDLNSAVGHYLRLRQLDPRQVLSRNAQLDIANQLAEMGRFPEAADAYELFLRHYPDSDQHPHIELLAGLLYARYLNDPVKAASRIEHALPRLTNARDVELAQAELARLKAGLPR